MLDVDAVVVEVGVFHFEIVALRDGAGHKGSFGVISKFVANLSDVSNHIFNANIILLLHILWRRKYKIDKYQSGHFDSKNSSNYEEEKPESSDQNQNKKEGFKVECRFRFIQNLAHARVEHNLWISLLIPLYKSTTLIIIQTFEVDPNWSDNYAYKFSYCAVKDHQCSYSHFCWIETIGETDHQNDVDDLVAVYSFFDVYFEDLEKTDSF